MGIPQLVLSGFFTLLRAQMGPALALPQLKSACPDLGHTFPFPAQSWSVSPKPPRTLRLLVLWVILGTLLIGGCFFFFFLFSESWLLSLGDNGMPPRGCRVLSG